MDRGSEIFQAILRNYLSLPGADPKRAPFLLEHGKKSLGGLLLVHGLSASPWEVLEAGKHAHARGFTVLGVRLAGHGTRVEDLDPVLFPQWLQSAEEGFSSLSYFSEKIVIAGLSLGALVSLRLSEKGLGEGVVSLSAPLYLCRSVKWMVSLAGLFGNRLPRPLSPFNRPYYYPAHSIHSLKEMEALSILVRKDLEKITQPILVIQSEYDKRVDQVSGKVIYEGVRSGKKELLMFKKNKWVPHVMTTMENPQLGEVLEKVTRFATAVVEGRGR